MSLHAAISGQISKDYVKVDVTSKNTKPRCFMVHNKKAKSFCENYPKKERKNTIINNAAFIGSTIGAVFLSNCIFKNVNKFLRFTLGTIAGVAGAMGAIIACSKYEADEDYEFMKKHKAKEIYCDA